MQWSDTGVLQDTHQQLEGNSMIIFSKVVIELEKRQGKGIQGEA